MAFYILLTIRLVIFLKLDPFDKNHLIIQFKF